MSPGPFPRSVPGPGYEARRILLEYDGSVEALSEYAEELYIC